MTGPDRSLRCLERWRQAEAGSEQDSRLRNSTPRFRSSLLGPALALGSLLLYSRTVAPSLGGTIDSAEFQQASYTLSIVHPTGYPLYLLAARAWISVFPFGDPAFRVNLLSSIFAALAVWVLYATVLHLTGSIPAGLSAAALFAVQAVPWAQAGVAEINSLNTLLTGLAFLTVLLWSAGRLPLYVPALAYGVALAHHRTALLYLPLLVIYGLVALRRGGPRPTSRRQVALAAALLVLPFLSYLYIPVRAFTTDWYSNTWEGFWAGGIRRVGPAGDRRRARPSDPASPPLSAVRPHLPRPRRLGAATTGPGRHSCFRVGIETKPKTPPAPWANRIQYPDYFTLLPSRSGWPSPRSTTSWTSRTTLPCPSSCGASWRAWVLPLS